MADAADVYLMEFEQLRDELVQRTNMSYALIALDLTVLGVGLTVFQTFPEIVVALAVVASFLWLIYIDHASQIYKIAAYIALRLAPRLEKTAPAAMQWESFLRQLDKGGREAAAALSGPGGDRIPRNWIVSGGPGRYVAALFAASPPVLLAAFAMSSRVGGDTLEPLLRLAVLLVTYAIWVGSIVRFCHFQETVRAINAAISAGAARPHEPDAATASSSDAARADQAAAKHHAEPNQRASTPPPPPRHPDQARQVTQSGPR